MVTEGGYVPEAKCDVDGCGALFTGKFARRSLGAHKWGKHKIGGPKGAVPKKKRKTPKQRKPIRPERQNGQVRLVDINFCPHCGHEIPNAIVRRTANG